MIRKITILSSCLLLLLGSLQAQEVKKVHVYMKDGSYYRHATLLETQLDYIRISLRASKDERPVELRVPTSEIHKLRYLDKDKPFKEEKPEGNIYYTYELGVMIGKNNSNESNNPFVTMKGVVGYRFHHLLKTGLGIGLDTYETFSSMPVFLDVRGNFLKSRVSPFYFIQGGNAKAWFTDNASTQWMEREIEVSWNYSLGMGVEFETGAADIILTAGYKRQKVKTSEFTEWGSDTIERRKINRFTVGFGVIF